MQPDWSQGLHFQIMALLVAVNYLQSIGTDDYEMKLD